MEAEWNLHKRIIVEYQIDRGAASPVNERIGLKSPVENLKALAFDPLTLVGFLILAHVISRVEGRRYYNQIVQ